MATNVNPQASRIATAAGIQSNKAVLIAKYAGRTPSATVSQAWAPAWFYSALNWLGRTYYDANDVSQGFTSYMAGSDVDPYQKLGSTRLFVIARVRETYRLSLAADAQTDASLTGGTSYPATDDGIRQMYIALSESAIFRRVKACYIPGRLGSDLDATGAAGPAGTGSAPPLESGYDPATGLRTVVLGSAVAQVVPLDDFLHGHNEQIYDAAPAIVPLVSALVYDVTHYNVLGAKTFVLPVYYGRDQVTAGRFMVNRFATTGDVAGSPATYGQTAVFPNGPGYDDAAATALRLQTTNAVSLGNRRRSLLGRAVLLGERPQRRRVEDPGEHHHREHGEPGRDGAGGPAAEAPGDPQLDQLGEHDRRPRPVLEAPQLPGAPAEPDAVHREEQRGRDAHGGLGRGERAQLRQAEEHQQQRLQRHHGDRHHQRRRDPAVAVVVRSRQGWLVGGRHGSRCYAPAATRPPGRRSVGRSGRRSGRARQNRDAHRSHPGKGVLEPLQSSAVTNVTTTEG